MKQRRGNEKTRPDVLFWTEDLRHLDEVVNIQQRRPVQFPL